jgi:hypothetical protein
MNEKNAFALVPRKSGAVEKTEPGAKRLLSGMVADTLELAKKNPPAKTVFTVLRSKGPIEEHCESMIKWELEPRYELRFIVFETEVELLQLARERPFDLIVLYLRNVSWTGKGGSLADVTIESLGRLSAQYRKPIFAMQGLKLAKQFEGTGIAFLQTPFRVEEFRRTLQICLKDSFARP